MEFPEDGYFASRIEQCIPTITPAMVRQAMLTFSSKKAAGSDYLTMEVLRALPASLVCELARLFCGKLD
eukprot:7839010-Alexandrium_andersonii.AAC.1